MAESTEHTPLLSSYLAGPGKAPPSHAHSIEDSFIDPSGNPKPSKFSLRFKIIVAMFVIPVYLVAVYAILQSQLSRAAPAPVASPIPQVPSGPFGSVLGPVISSNFPDPAVYYENGITYAFATNNRGESPLGMIHVQMATSSDNVTWELSTQDALPQVGPWETGRGVWAPDVVKAEDGTYVMYYTDSLVGREQSHCLGIATSQTIMGPYTPQPDPWACPDPEKEGGAIDPDGFHDVSTGRWYVTYKIDGNSLGHGGSCNNGKEPLMATPIMLQEVGSDGISKIGEPTPILDRDQMDGPLIEAPALHRSDGGIYFLFYSGNCFTTPLYDTAYATATDIRGPYVKAARPLLISGDGPDLVGPGGLDIITNGQMVVFHGHMTPTNDASMARTVRSKAVELGKPMRDVQVPFVRGMYTAVATFNGHEVSLEATS